MNLSLSANKIDQKTFKFQLFPDNSMHALRKLSAISADKPWGKF